MATSAAFATETQDTDSRVEIEHAMHVGLNYPNALHALQLCARVQVSVAHVAWKDTANAEVTNHKDIKYRANYIFSGVGAPAFFRNAVSQTSSQCGTAGR